MLIRIRPFLVLMMTVFVAAGAAAERPVIAISSYTPSEGDPYSTFGAELVAYLESIYGDRFEFRNLPSDGSIQNLERLRLDGEVQLAICQEDVAYYYYAGGNEIFTRGHGDELTVTAMARLFNEEAYLVVRPGIEHPRQIETMFVGKHLSGSYATYCNYRTYHRPVPWNEVQEGDGHALLAAGEVDAVFEVGSTPNLDLLRFAADFDCRLIRIPRNEVSLDLDLYRPVVIPDSLTPGRQSVETISVPALLLAKRDLPAEVATSIIAAIMDEDRVQQIFPESAAYLQAISASQDREENVPTLPRLTGLPLPPHPSVVVFTLGRFPYMDFLIIALATGLLGLLLTVIPRVGVCLPCYRFCRATEFRRKRHVDVVIIVAAVFWVVMACWGIKFHEIRGLIRGYSLLDSAFVHMGARDLLGWATVFASTSHPDTGFPVIGLAKALAVSVHLVGIGLITWLGARLISFLVARIMSERNEMNLTGSTNHIVICNWNKQGARLVQQLRDPGAPKAKRKRPIVVISTDPESRAFTEGFTDVNHCTANPWDPDVFKKTALHRADSVIILAPPMESEADADGVVLRTALAVRSGFASEHVDMPHVLAQLHKPQEPNVINEVGISEFVCSDDLGSRVLAQAVISPGITDFFSEILMHAEDSNEVYLKELPADLHKDGADFWSVVEYYLEHGDQAAPALPIGLRVKLDEGRGGRNQVATLLNPSVSRLRSLGVSRFQAGDQVIVFADFIPQHAGN